MTNSKKYLIIVGITVIILIALSLFLSKEYSTNVKTELNAPALVVYNALNNLSYQNDWNGKAVLDTSFHVFCLAQNQGVQSFCDYRSNDYGNGVFRMLLNQKDSIVITDEPNNRPTKIFKYKITEIDSTHCLLLVNASSHSGFMTNLWNFIHKWKLSKHIKHSTDQLKIFVENRWNNKIYNLPARLLPTTTKVLQS